MSSTEPVAERAVLVEGGIGGEAGRADQRPAQAELVEQALLEAIGDRREGRDVLQSFDHDPDVRFGHADLVGGALDDLVFLREAALRARVHLGGVTQQSVPVQRRARRFSRAAGRREKDDAVEVRRPGAVLDRSAFGVQHHPAARPAVGEQVAGDREGALHAAGDLPRVRFVFDAGDGERRGAALGYTVRKVRVPELGEGVVARRRTDARR